MDSESNMTTPFDPFTQPLTIGNGYGKFWTVTMDDLWQWDQYSTRICINYSSQLGASAVLLFIIIILTKPSKRFSPIFLSNTLSLLLNIPRTLFATLYFTSEWYAPYVSFSADYSFVPASAVNISVASAIFNFLILIPILISLVLQVQVVTVTATDVQKLWIMFASISIASLALGFRFALSVINAIMIRQKTSMLKYYWLAHATNVTLTIAICFFCAVFSAKLGYAVLRRRQLGLKKFGPMQIIFIMGCQTFIVPAIFSGLQYATSAPELGSQVYTVVAIFLPLSALWASTVIDERKTTPTLIPRGRDQHGCRRRSSLFSGSVSTKVSSGDFDILHFSMKDLESGTRTDKQAQADQGEME